MGEGWHANFAVCYYAELAYRQNTPNQFGSLSKVIGKRFTRYLKGKSYLAQNMCMTKSSKIMEGEGHCRKILGGSPNTARRKWLNAKEKERKTPYKVAIFLQG